MSAPQTAAPTRYTPEQIDRIIALSRSGITYSDKLIAIIEQLREDLADEEVAHEDVRVERDFLAGELETRDATPVLCARCDREVKAYNPARNVVEESAA